MSATISINAGDTPTRSFPLTITDGLVFNGSASQAIFTVGLYPGAGASDILITKSSALGTLSILQDPTTLVWSVIIPFLEADTATLTPGPYYFSLLVIDQSGVRTTAATGIFTVLPAMSP